MASDSQMKANRKNARKSKGPTTAGGKARSKMNGLKHGLTSKSVVIGAEDPRQFRRFSRRFMKALGARDPIEHELIVGIVMSAWRRRRAYQLECGVFSEEAPSDLGVDPDDPKYLGLAFTRTANNGDAVGRLLRYEAAHRRAFYQALRYLEQRRRKAVKK